MIIPETFDKNDSNGIRSHLDKEGYVVIRDILTKEEKDNSFSLFKKDWLTVTPTFNFDDLGSMSIKNSPLIFAKGMAVFNGFGNSDFMWSLRTNKSIRRVFSKIYTDEELVVSLDGFSFFFTNKQKSKPWLHVDQNPVNKVYSIQGSYNFLPVEKDSSGFVVVPRSHLEYNPNVRSSKDWIPLNEEDVKIYGDKAVKLLIPENCLTVWNSKTIHANTGMTARTPRLDRLTCYISYLPKSLRSNDILLERVKAYLDGETTSHWSNKCEVKKYPYGFGPTYEKRGYNRIKPTLDEEGNIPSERLELI